MTLDTNTKPETINYSQFINFKDLNKLYNLRNCLHELMLEIFYFKN